MKNKALTVQKKGTVIKTIEKELRKEMEEKVKDIVKRKMKQIKMAEITLDNLKTELNDILSGKTKITEEELLFEDE